MSFTNTEAAVYLCGTFLIIRLTKDDISGHFKPDQYQQCQGYLQHALNSLDWMQPITIQVSHKNYFVKFQIR